MEIKPEKMCDGFFVFPEPRTIAIAPGATQTKEELEQIMKEWDCSVNKYLESIEKRIRELKTVPRDKAKKETQKLQQHIDDYKELDQINGYVSDALIRLKFVRKQLEKGNTEGAIIDTINMMDAYWMGKIHADYKLNILRDRVHTKPKKTGGNMTGQNKKDAAKPRHDRIREQAAEKWQKNNRASINAVATFIKDRYENDLSVRQISEIIKSIKPTPNKGNLVNNIQI